MNPDARGTFWRLPPPGITAARPPSPCALPSNTLRKQSTCLARPNATAIAPSITAPSWPGRSMPAAPPPQVEPQRVVHVDDTGAGEPRRLARGAGIRGDAVDVGGGEAGVLDRGEARVERELERVAESRRPMSDCPTPLMTVSSCRSMASVSRDGSLVTAHAGSNIGIHTSSSSWASNVTCTGMPMCTSSTRAVHDHVVSRRPFCSGNSTIASTKGSSGTGIHGWWLIVNVWTVARPEASS